MSKADEPVDRSERYAKLIALIEEWSADESGYEERVWPLLKDLIEENRLSYRKRFEETEPCPTNPASE